MLKLFKWVGDYLWSEQSSPESNNEDEEEIVNDCLSTYISDELLTGKVTDIKTGLVEIDFRYVAESKLNFELGQGVSYILHKTRNNERISNVQPLKNEEESTTSYVNATGYIDKRQGAIIVVDNVNYSLEGVESTFVPCVGDQVDLIIRETTIHTKQTYFLVEITPSKKYFLVGQITEWNGYEGVINGDVYINGNYCKFSSSLTVGDKILACVIAYKSIDFNLRAIYVQISGAKFHSKPIFIEELPNINVIAGSKKFFEVNMFNLSTRWQNILSLSVHPSDSVKLITPLDLKIVPPEACVPYKFCVETEGLRHDAVRVKILWRFNRFILGRSFNVKLIGVETGKCGVDWDRADQVVLSAPRISRKANYKVTSLDPYPLPHEIHSLASQMERWDSAYLIQQFQKFSPAIVQELSPDNYVNNLHFLLYLEEVSLVDRISELDIVAPLFSRGDDVLIKFESETSHFDLLSFGDKVYAVLIWDESISFEGDIKDISPKEIVARFHPKFHRDFVSGRVYQLKFISSRVNLRRQHQAVDICGNVLKRRLFPKYVEPVVNNFNYRTTVKEWYNAKLNKEQKTAIMNILEGSPGEIPYILYGPPGSGKTVTLVELILQIVTLQPFARILVVAPSNSAVDAIAVNLLLSGVLMKRQILRLGSLRYFVRGDVPVSLTEVTCFLSDSDKPSFNVNIPLINYDSLGSHNVTLGTFSTIGLLTSIRFSKTHFSHIIIDEAGQVTEPECLIPLTVLNDRSGHIILSGDPLQLGPIIFSKTAADLGLKESLLSRLSNRYPYSKDVERFPESLGYDPRIITKLVLNYRALPELVSMSSSVFYDNELLPVLTSDSPEAFLLQRIQLNFDWNNLRPLLFHHVSGTEEQPEGSTSWINKAEAMKVVMFLAKLYHAGVSPDEIGIITPYKKQIKLILDFIQELTLESPKVGSVEEFQGLERNVIIVSLVRSADVSPSSFVNEPKRINVATSRAKALLLIVGNKKSLQRSSIWRQTVNLCQEVSF